MNSKNKLIWVLGMLLIYAMIFSTCQTSAPKVNRETQLERVAAENPNDAEAQYEWGKYLLFIKKDFVQAASVFERALAIDPDYRATIELHWTPATAAINGILVTENVFFDDCSLFLMLGDALEGSTRTRSTGVFAEEDKQNALEKALAVFRRAYEIDITGGKNPSENLKIVYLAYMAGTLDNLNRQDEALEVYIELAKIVDVTDTIALRIWDKIIAESENLSPFEGYWSYRINKPEFRTEKRSYQEGSGGYWDYNNKQFMHRPGRTVYHDVQVPTGKVLTYFLSYEFNGINYKKIMNKGISTVSVISGTFSYNGNSIYLDDRTVLHYNNNEIKVDLERPLILILGESNITLKRYMTDSLREAIFSSIRQP